MALFSISGLKKAYEAVGAEINRTFDSTTEGEESKGEHSPEREIQHSSLSEDSSDKRHGGDDGWGGWGEQGSGWSGGDGWSQKGESSMSQLSVTPQPQSDLNSRAKLQSPSSPDARLGGRTSTPVGTPVSGGRMEERVADQRKGGNKGPSMKPQSTDKDGSSAAAETKGGDAPVERGVSPSSSTPSRPAAAGKGQLESLSREELVKYVRKQAQLLHKTKGRCDELNKECEKLRNSSTGPSKSSDSESLMEELLVVRSERDRVMAEWKGAKQSVAILEQDKQHLASQVEDLERGKATVQQLYEQLKNESSSLQEDMKCQLEAGRTRTEGMMQLHSREKEELQSQVSQLENELEEQRSKVTVIATEKADHVDEVSALRERLKKAEDTCHQLRETVASLQEEPGRLAREKEQADKLREEVERISSELAASRKEHDGISSELTDKVTELERTNSVLTELRDQARCSQEKASHDKDSLLAELSEARAVLSRSQGDLREKEKTAEALEMENERLKKECGGLEGRVAEFESQMVSLSEELEVVRGEREQQAEQLRAQLTLARETLQHSSADVESVQTEKQDLERELTQSRAKIVELESNLRNQTSQLDSMVVERKAFTEQTTRETAELESRIGDLESRLVARDAELDSATKEKENLSDRLGEVEKELQAKVQELEKSGHEMDSLTTRTVSLEASVKSQAEELQLLRSEREERNSRAARLEEENEALRADVDKKGTEKESEEGEEERAGQIESLQRELGEVRRRCEEAEKEREQLQQTADSQQSSHREESRKLKAFVMKIKKELSETKEREVSLKKQSGISQSELQEVKEKLEASERERETLRQELGGRAEAIRAEQQSAEDGAKNVQELESQLVRLRSECSSMREREAESAKTAAALSSEKDSLLSQLRGLEESQEVLQSELATVQSELATLASEASVREMDNEKVREELQAVREELSRERESHGGTREKLTIAQKEAKSSSLIDLELADYQRSMQSLETQLAEKVDELKAAKREGQAKREAAEQLRQEMKSLEQQRGQDEERMTKIKALLKKTRKELEETRKQESDLKETVSSLQSQVEEEKQHSELAKVEVSQLTAKLQSAQQQSDVKVGTLQKTVRTLEIKMGSLQNELTGSHSALTQCQQEYESYKVRVHSVLKQKSNGPSQAEVHSELRERYESDMAKLKTELHEAKEHLSSVLTEHEELLVEHDQLAGRHEQLLADSQDSQDKWQRKLQETESRHQLLNQEQSELISQLRGEVESVTTAFKTQLHALQDDHAKTLSALRDDLHSSQKEVLRLQQEADAHTLARAANQESSGNGDLSRPLSLTRSRIYYRSHSNEMKLSIPPEKRSQGEGMEQTELESVSSFPPTPLSREDSQLSFERLLGSSEAGGESGTGERLTASEVRVHKLLRSAMKKIDHLTEVLRESEANSMRLADQAKLLKEEIRRLERNQEREKGVSNLEYLKNVVLKFLHAEGPERKGLIPVINELLQLSPQEVKFLEETLKGFSTELPSPTGAAVSPAADKGWSGYIHRWTGY